MTIRNTDKVNLLLFINYEVKSKILQYQKMEDKICFKYECVCVLTLANQRDAPFASGPPALALHNRCNVGVRSLPP